MNIAIRTFFASLLLFSALSMLALASTPALATEPAPVAALEPPPTAAGQPEHVVTEAEIQAGIDERVHSEASDRQAIRDLLARPEVKRIAGQAGLDLVRANDGVAILSGPELERLASQAREVNSQAIAGDRITMSSTTIIIILLIIVLIIVLAD